MPFCSEGELAALWARNGLVEVETCAINVTADYADFEDYWIRSRLGLDRAGRTAHRWTRNDNSNCKPVVSVGLERQTDRSLLPPGPLPCAAVEQREP